MRYVVIEQWGCQYVAEIGSNGRVLGYGGARYHSREEAEAACRTLRESLGYRLDRE